MDCLELMGGIDYEVLQEGNPHRTVMGIEYDSRRIRRGYVFVCLRGTVESGVHFLKQAACDGAIMAVTQEAPVEIPEGLRVLLVEDVMRVMPVMASTYYHNPSQDLYLAGVTGTNGKTTTTTLMYHIFQHAGEKTALVGTIENRIGALRLPAYNTTPQALDLQRLFRQMQDEGVKWAVMEVSSHALALHRVDALQFDIGVFTNLTLDHLDFHKTMEAYLEAKSLLFRKARIGLLNADDPASRAIEQTAECLLYTYGLEGRGDFQARDIRMSAQGFEFSWYQGDTLLGIVAYPAPGRFNVYNVLAAASACYLAGVPKEQIMEALRMEEGMVKGRFQRLTADDGLTVIVDYAHAPDGLENVLSTIHEFVRGRVITIFGCGGDRDTSKRPIMGEIAGRNSDYCIMTSDNPRTEDPLRILHEIEAGIRKTSCPYEMVEDRRTAIERGVRMASPEDVVLVAGKGHEDYQIVGRHKIHFDDVEEVLNAFKQRKNT